MDKVAEDNKEKTVKEILALLKKEAIAIHEEDIQMCLNICEYGLSLLKDGDGVLTHCNAGPLATSLELRRDRSCWQKPEEWISVSLRMRRDLYCRERD